MSITGANLLVGLSKFVNDYENSTTTSAGNSGGTTVVDTYLGRYGDGRLRGMWIRLTSGTSTLQVRRITENLQSSGTVTVSPAFSAQVASAVTYELHRYDPRLKFRALDEARFECFEDVYRLTYNILITSDGISKVHRLTWRSGDENTTIAGYYVDSPPLFAEVEHPIEVDTQWNFLTSPRGDSLTGWTASSATASIVTRGESDPIIPKYDASCTKLVVAGSTNGTYTQVVGDMSNGVTAALAADRGMAANMWVYATESNRVSLRIIDDGQTINDGAIHSGAGWELLRADGFITGNNATTLSVRLNVTSDTNPVVVFWNRAWFYYGTNDRVGEDIWDTQHKYRVRWDDSTRALYMDEVVPRGYSIRLASKAPLSALGDVAATQATNTMEVDAQNVNILYASAAETLFQWERVSTDNVQEVAQRIQMVRERRPKLESNWAQETPPIRIKNPFMY